MLGYSRRFYVHKINLISQFLGSQYLVHLTFLLIINASIIIMYLPENIKYVGKKFVK